MEVSQNNFIKQQFNQATLKKSSLNNNKPLNNTSSGITVNKSEKDERIQKNRRLLVRVLALGATLAGGAALIYKYMKKPGEAAKEAEKIAKKAAEKFDDFAFNLRGSGGISKKNFEFITENLNNSKIPDSTKLDSMQKILIHIECAAKPDELSAKTLGVMFKKTSEIKKSNFGVSKTGLLSDITITALKNPYFKPQKIGFKDHLDMIDACKKVFKSAQQTNFASYQNLLLQETIIRSKKLMKGDFSQTDKIIEVSKEHLEKPDTIFDIFGNEGTKQRLKKALGMVKEFLNIKKEVYPEFTESSKKLNDFYTKAFGKTSGSYSRSYSGFSLNKGLSPEQIAKNKQTLGIAGHAEVNKEVLKKAFRRQSMKYHPDRYGNKPEAERKAAEEAMKNITQANRELKEHFGIKK